MITIGTAKFDFRADNEPFAYSLNGRWDTFFHTAFETVVEEVLSAYDQTDCVITIEYLPLNLGKIDEERFDKKFSLRLREALESYCREHLNKLKKTGTGQKGVEIISTGKNAFELLSFFLLHGYFPFTTEEHHTDLNRLLRIVIAEEPYRFKEFLNAYGHYDSLCRRLVFQFTDEELEQIVRIVQPSESKFITLYVRVQIRACESFKRPDISRENYRGVVWTLVLAYLFTEGAGYFSRRHIVLYTMRGLAAHLNLTLVEMVRIFTESIRELGQIVEQLPELWTILKEIRRDMKAELWALDGNFHSHLMREVVSALRMQGKKEAEYILSREHLVNLFSKQGSCRKLLNQLQEKEIYSLVAVLVPQEKEYVISYASMLDKHKDAGTFSGRAGSEFCLLKWEFIFITLVALPASTLNRRQFVLSVLQRLAAHYNFSVTELIHFLNTDEELLKTVLSPELLSVLQELYRLFQPEKKHEVHNERSVDEWLSIFQTPLLLRKYLENHTERQVVLLVNRLFPAYSNFIVSYATLLDKAYGAGILEGRAGGEFATLKWEFIFSCFVSDNNIVFYQKVFVYFVLQKLAAHYNQEVVELIGYFLHSFPGGLTGQEFDGLKSILKELYDEKVLPLTNISRVRSKSDMEIEHWILELFGNTSTILIRSNEESLEKWLVYFLSQRNNVFRSLWKSGKLKADLLLQVVSRTASLRSLWLSQIGDERLETIYKTWSVAYMALRSRFAGLGYLEQLGEYISIWMVELTANKYSAWSETELIRFLAGRVRQSIPPGYTMLLEEMLGEKDNNKNVTEIINQINELNEKGTSMEKVMVNNAGMLLLQFFLPRMYRMADYLESDARSFKDENSKIRAIFLLQYLVYGEEKEYSENELYLNKILVSLNDGTPLPKRCKLNEQEIRVVEDMILMIKRMWDKMKHTSDIALRQAFFQREGVVTYETSLGMSRWIIEVRERPYDVLLDSIPWSYTMYRYPWIDDIVEVRWRN